jgi:1-deoxy-D-xylulose-5-phosphate synthase
VILNDNEMSISENVGALSQLLRARAGPASSYAQLARGRQEGAEADAHGARIARRSEEHMKGMVLPGTMFEELGFNYIGPIDGHDLKALVSTLRNMRDAQGPAVPARRHAQGQGLCAGRGRPHHLARTRSVRPGSGRDLQGKGQRARSIQEGLRRLAVRHGRRDPRIVGITPAMREGSGLVEFSRRFPGALFTTSPSPSSMR